MVGRRPEHRRESREQRNRGVLRSLVRLCVAAALLCGLVFGTMVLSPYALESLDDLGTVDDIRFGDRPSPSSDPPPAGERDPEVTDPNDPGESSYETDIEAVSSETVEDFVHAEVNDRRAEHGLGPLEWDGTVGSVARAHSYDMADREYFGHTNPDGDGPYDRFTAVDDYCQGYGENIALTWVDRSVEEPGGNGIVTYRTAEAVATGLVNQWMNSTDHRDAILENHDTPGWDRAGVGVYITDEGQVYASQNFCHEW
ncbi:CAP domain-containing protein [Halopiger djelfimassiliensis]|uniref:CAP domain-containing protein n=1 Tax=Halopiger djelfimassiliensis TaxID=1293047 RepID=UPI000677B6E2|nr:CAP domain-containing protein [Halopiger djelfimassiliensis]